MQAIHRHRRSLRALLVALLVLGMVITPALAAAGEVHDIEHAAADADGIGHTHSADSDHHQHPHDHDGRDGGTDPDHAAGAHGLMHQTSSVSIALPEAILGISTVSSCAQLAPECPGLPALRDRPDLPFRPPIA